MWDLRKFDTTSLFMDYCDEGCPNNTLTVIGSFNDPDSRDKFRDFIHRAPWRYGKVPCNIFENKCRLCGGTAERKNKFLKDVRKSPELKRIFIRDKKSACVRHPFSTVCFTQMSVIQFNTQFTERTSHQSPRLCLGPGYALSELSDTEHTMRKCYKIEFDKTRFSSLR